ncbi:type IV pilin N-terminal domain-containing protein [Methanoculleus taiwanensis]|uniref:type IV pilin N-terminal domain-containing protein n=1 Tax=Methanoculleus taiwanensis TaxID=1550565 RepID=UPI000FFE5E22|nr:type IV pilin N-terminal domain-containing protein [Methanoculleus taiwanensis]
MVSRDDSAVSPVVGVMLMLVVTVIIAAVVSAFAGGLAETQSKTPQVTINAKYSQSEGMTIYHEGGDILSIGEFKILLHPSSNYGSIEEQTYVSAINLSLLQNGQGGLSWYKSGKGGRQVSRFAPGDIAYISAVNCTTQNLTPNMYAVSGTRVTDVGIINPQYVGSSFFLEMVTLDGKMIAKVEVPIQS